MSETEQTKGGQPIYRHEEVERDWQAPQFEEAVRVGFEEHLNRFFGSDEITVWHEIVSDLVHIDVYMVRSSAERPFYTLITSGMSDLPMTLPEGMDAEARAELERAELVMCLPPDWPLSQEAFEDAANYWPIGLLKMLARLPHEYSTWLGVGHSVPNGQSGQAFPGTQFTGVVLGPPVDLPEDFWTFQVNLQGVQTTVRFYGLFPLYTEEMDYKINTPEGAWALFKKFEPFGVRLIVDVNRPNVITAPPPARLSEA
ncbi:suppressor of fused domain protein [Deinococcus lacus]|uniref:Suppressor of fused domain protein n=1 Tax=Deinococcus lacus TaxID=392561 RepID=A0ABW1YD96_9DEIO